MVARVRLRRIQQNSSKIRMIVLSCHNLCRETMTSIDRLLFLLTSKRITRAAKTKQAKKSRTILVPQYTITACSGPTHSWYNSQAKRHFFLFF